MNLCRKLFDIAGVDNLIVLLPSNTFYLSGYSSTNCQIIITKSKSYFLTDMRYFLEAREKLSDNFEVVCQDLNSGKTLLDSGSVGFEADISYRQYRDLQELVGDRKLVDITDQIASLRDIKSLDEIGKIQSAQRVTELAFEEALKFIRLGVSERELAAYIEYIMLKSGCDIAFESIVAFGEHTASPHAHRSDKRLQDGDFITMDIGAKFDGYCSDMTRTVGYGQISTKQVEIYNEVLKAQNLAIDNIKSGMKGRDCDKIARDYFAEKKLDKYFTHSLGHGVGIDIHEGVGFTPREERTIRENMIVTVEPGLYIEGKFGVRIEDMVLITKSSVKDLTKADKQLIIL
ncbi:MAG: aminopeptidase P family protein [Clostridia bacterium]|nr:aminopeptidase P family protein [Clostridia bacterium]MDE7328667.1 aminopeptidase P family protein [Clostridia bacterium]